MAIQIVKRKVFRVPHVRGVVYVSARDTAEALAKAMPFARDEHFTPTEAFLAWEEDHKVEVDEEVAPALQ